MKILTIGVSPYLLTSQAKINAIVMKYLYFSGYSMAGIVTHHDPSYFLPEENSNGQPAHYYTIDKHKIPIVPLTGRKDPSIEVYEIMKKLQPDILITIGDINDFLYMKAVNMFVESPFKWLAIMMNYSRPINENNREVMTDIDGIICTSKHGMELVRDTWVGNELDFAYVGTELSEPISTTTHDKFRVMISGNNCQSDNIPTLMETIQSLHKEKSDIELYIHTNIHDKGDFDFRLLKERFGPNDEFISFPDKYVSVMDGYSNKDFQAELSSSDLFVSIPMNSASGLTLFEAVACGCIPIMSDVGCHGEISEIFGNLLPGFKSEDLLVPCVDLLVKGEVYLGICDPEALRSRISYAKKCMKKKVHKKEGHKEHLKEFVKDHKSDHFLKKVIGMVENVYKIDTKLCVESV